MKLNKIIKCSFTSIVPMISMVSIVSCGKTKTRDFSKYKRDFSKIDWSKYNYRDGILENWDRDADTPEVILKNKDGTPYEVGEKEQFGLRIMGIDAPELHSMNKDGKFVETTGKEKELSEMSQTWAKKHIPSGSKIRVYVGAEDRSYDRLVGSLFYGKNYQHNLSVELLALGYVNPFSKIKDGYKEEKGNIFNEIALPMADAFNYAYHKKLGIFSDENQKALKIHGSTDFTSVLWDKKLPRILALNNVYYIEGILELPKKHRIKHKS